MREIKFRAWDKKFTENESVMFYQTYPNSPHMEGNKELESCGWNKPQGSLTHILGTDMIIMQYTGLRDSNNVEIYDGDIVKFTNENDYIAHNDNEPSYLKGEVTYRDCNFAITNVPTKFGNENDNYWLGSKRLVFIEVIGNIYENPEILENASTNIKKTSNEWNKHRDYKDIVIFDPDGWDRGNFQYSFFEEKITKEEFDKRLCMSTCQFNKKTNKETR